MVTTTIILALAVLIAALVVGVFVVALIELNEIDEIVDGSQPAQPTGFLRAIPDSNPGAAEL